MDRPTYEMPYQHDHRDETDEEREERERREREEAGYDPDAPVSAADGDRVEPAESVGEGDLVGDGVGDGVRDADGNADPYANGAYRAGESDVRDADVLDDGDARDSDVLDSDMRDDDLRDDSLRENDELRDDDLRAADVRDEARDSEVFGTDEDGDGVPDSERDSGLRDSDVLVGSGSGYADPVAFPEGSAAPSEGPPVGTATGTASDAEVAETFAVAEAPTAVSGPSDSFTSGSLPETPDFGQRWHEIKASFVDDPRKSVEMADALVEEAVNALTAIRQTLSDRWRNATADDTEQLRLTLREYHALFDQLNSGK